MVLLLHQVESLRTFVIGSIRMTDSFKGKSEPGRLPLNAKNPMEKALAILVAMTVLTEHESEDLQKIIGLRNQIGHRIHELVEDISAPKSLRYRDSIYDYFALRRFENLRDKITKGMMNHFILEIGFRDLSFEQAEATYKEELARLRTKIDKQFEIRRAKLA